MHCTRSARGGPPPCTRHGCIAASCHGCARLTRPIARVPTPPITATPCTNARRHRQRAARSAPARCCVHTSLGAAMSVLRSSARKGAGRRPMLAAVRPALPSARPSDTSQRVWCRCWRLHRPSAVRPAAGHSSDAGRNRKERMGIDPGTPPPASCQISAPPVLGPRGAALLPLVPSAGSTLAAKPRSSSTCVGCVCVCVCCVRKAQGCAKHSACAPMALAAQAEAPSRTHTHACTHARMHRTLGRTHTAQHSACSPKHAAPCRPD
jgi:hypothetical protein